MKWLTEIYAIKHYRVSFLMFFTKEMIVMKNIATIKSLFIIESYYTARVNEKSCCLPSSAFSLRTSLKLRPLLSVDSLYLWSASLWSFLPSSFSPVDFRGTARRPLCQLDTSATIHFTRSSNFTMTFSETAITSSCWETYAKWGGAQVWWQNQTKLNSQFNKNIPQFSIVPYSVCGKHVSKSLMISDHLTLWYPKISNYIYLKIKIIK